MLGMFKKRGGTGKHYVTHCVQEMFAGNTSGFVNICRGSLQEAVPSRVSITRLGTNITL